MPKTVTSNGKSRLMFVKSDKIEYVVTTMTRETQNRLLKLRGLLLGLLLATPSIANAHPEKNTLGGFLAGVEHPLTGLDHIVAMVGVGLWGAYLGAPAIWLLPVIFPLVMAVGGAVGVIVGIPSPAVEAGIAISGVVLGFMVAAAARPPLWIAAVIVGFFAVFHGYSHGVELPRLANPFTYAAGFVIATGLLHLTGISLGLLTKWPWGKIMVRGLGGVISVIGFAFLFGFL